MSVQATPQFFAQYDTLGQEEASLAGIENRLAAAQSALQKVTSDERNAENTNKALAKKMKERKELIETCQTHWFFGTTFFQPQLWFKGGVEGKIDRQQEKLKKDEASQPGLLEKERMLEQQVAQQQDQVNGLAQTNARKQQLHAQREQMFEQVVATAATPAYQQLTAGIGQQQQLVAQEQNTVRAMQGVVGKIDGARNEYMAAIRDLHSAARQNNEAQRDNQIDGFENFERMEQERRDRLMRAAQGHASHGANQLTQALQCIPPAARGRHSHLCGGLGVVSLPQLQQTGGAEQMLERFGGDRGDAVAGMIAGQKIHSDVQLMQQCEHEVANQANMARALLGALRQDAANAQAQLQQLQAQLTNEKQNIFNGLRAAAGMAQPMVPMGGAVPTVAAQPVTQQMAQPVAPAFAAPASGTEHLAAQQMQDAWRARTAAVAVPMGAPMGQPTPTAMAQPAMAQPMGQPAAMAQPAMAMPMGQQPPMAQPAMAQPVQVM